MPGYRQKEFHEALASRLLKITNVLVRFDHSPRFIENANHCIM
jgi:hypothetical protein